MTSPSEAFRRLAGREASVVASLAGGANSGVWRVEDVQGGIWLLKRYGAADEDGRDRLAREYGALTWLKAQGVDEVPAPLFADPVNGDALYEFIPGARVEAASIGAAEVDMLLAFIGRLRELARGSRPELPPASEACFSATDAARAIVVRLRRMESAMGEHGMERELREFIDRRFRPLFERALTSCVSPDEEPLDASLWLPSPADVGFHNVLRRADGRLVFVDFEYFGWDDPAKTCADFLLHPAMSLSADLRRRFRTGMATMLSDDADFSGRVRRIYPLHLLKWCLIVLNVFTREGLARRRLAGRSEGQAASLLRRQLDRAAGMLDRFERLGEDRVCVCDPAVKDCPSRTL